MRNIPPLRLRIAACLASIPILAAGGFLSLPFIVLRGERIAPNCHVEGIAIGGLTRHEASARLQPALSGLIVTFHAGGRTFTSPLTSFGGSPDLPGALAAAFATGRTGWLGQRSLSIIECWRRPHVFKLRFVFESQQLTTSLRKIAWQVNRAPVSASLRLVEDHLIPSADKAGIRLDVAATAEKVRASFDVRQGPIEAVQQTIPAHVRMADIERIDAPLVSFSTWYNAGQANRSSNIRLCAKRLTGTILMPGDTFSFNQSVGERTPGRGFRLAPIFVNKEKAIGYGGGVCQVSSTVYNAARNANLRIIERHSHSLPVAYVAEGRDATVVYPYSDMKFKNTSDTPLFVTARANGGRLTVVLWGEPSAKISRSDVTARLRMVKYPEKKKPHPPKPETKPEVVPPPVEPPVPPPVASPAADLRP